MRSRWLCWLLMAVLLLGCQVANQAGGQETEMQDAVAAGMVGAVDLPQLGRAKEQLAELSDRRGRGKDQEGSNADDDGGADRGDGERMRIYQGNMTVEVARREDAAAQFLSKVKDWGGYLATQQDDQYTLRLPTAHFEDAIAVLRGMGRVLRESRQANDVTDQFFDLGLRLENARKSRERLLVLLAKAEKVEDMLKIEEQLRRLTEEIERFEGQQKMLLDQVAMATIAVRFAVAAASLAQPDGRKSRFLWIRSLGAERMQGGF